MLSIVHLKSSRPDKMYRKNTLKYIIINMIKATFAHYDTQSRKITRDDLLLKINLVR